MRLLNARTLRLEESFNNHESKPKYAILSHTWGSEEVTFEDVQEDTARKKKGFAKLQYTCDQAIKDGLEYVWIDTCCIDKSSSAELSEAINSMFGWYHTSHLCYAYLEDVGAEDLLDSCIPESHHMLPFEERKFSESHFAKSRWFTRGWTLQELIAPSRVEFYGKDWAHLGSSSDLLDAVVLITGIDINILSSNGLDKMEFLRRTSVAQRMSWASKRVTTRVEDEAYCLMGIFEINMPLLYGEGHAAFIRLQEEVIKTSPDQSIFVWNVPASEGHSDDEALHSLLAPDPSYFKACANVVQWPRQAVQESFSMTNVGLSIRLPILKRPNGLGDLAVLSCRHSHKIRGPIAIALKDAGTNGMLIQSYIIQRPTYTVGIEEAKAAIRSHVTPVILHRRPAPNALRLRTMVVNPNSPFPTLRTPTTFAIHERLIGQITIETHYPSMHWIFDSSGVRHGQGLLRLPRHINFGALEVRYKGVPLAIMFGRNEEWQPADVWIAIRDIKNGVDFRDVVCGDGRVSDRKMTNRAWFQKFPEEILELFIVRKEVMDETVFEINGTIRKKTLALLRTRS
jgi:hypothetical protein